MKMKQILRANRNSPAHKAQVMLYFGSCQDSTGDHCAHAEPRTGPGPGPGPGHARTTADRRTRRGLGVEEGRTNYKESATTSRRPSRHRMCTTAAVRSGSRRASGAPTTAPATTTTAPVPAPAHTRHVPLAQSLLMRSRRAELDRPIPPNQQPSTCPPNRGKQKPRPPGRDGRTPWRGAARRRRTRPSGPALLTRDHCHAMGPCGHARTAARREQMVLVARPALALPVTAELGGIGSTPEFITQGQNVRWRERTSRMVVGSAYFRTWYHLVPPNCCCAGAAASGFIYFTINSRRRSRLYRRREIFKKNKIA